MANTDGPWIRFYASDWLAGTRGMTAAETGVYITLIATMYEHGEPIVRDDPRLARVCGLNTRNFVTILDRLIDTDKIIVVDLAKLWGRKVESEVQNRASRAERGRLAAAAKHEQKQRPFSARAPLEQAPSTSQTVPRGRASEPEPESEVDKKGNRQVAASPSPDRADQESWWLEFWQLYPHKVGKPDAGKAFTRAIKRTDRQTMMAGLRAYIAKPDDRPWCNPSTWLNQDRWADQPAQQQGRQVRQPTAADVGRAFIERFEEHERETTRRADHTPTRQLIAPTER